MKVINTKFKDLKILKDINYHDDRGYFREILKKNYFTKKNFVFWCMSKSKKNVIRGLHIQNKVQQDKLVSVIKGKIYDVVIDLRKKSKTYLSHVSIIVSEGKNMVFIPKGCAHGFCTLQSNCIISYFHDNIYKKSKERGILWKSKKLKIKFKIKPKFINKKDSKYKDISFIKKFNV